MSTIVTRAGKGSPLTWNEVDNNFTNLNTDKLQSGNTAAALTITSATINGGTITGTALNGTLGATTPSTIAATTISASGVSTFSAGTAGAPALTTTGDTNTGIFFPAADTIAFSEGGAETMRLTSTGNVGIGTASPAYKLDVVGQIQSTSDVRVKKTGSDTVASGPFFYLNSGDGSNNGNIIQLNASNGLDIWNSVGGSYTKQLTLNTSGNLGLGVTPSAWGSGLKAIQLTGGSMWGNSSVIQFSQNNFYNGTNYIYSTTAQASDYYQYLGTHVWRTAPSGTAGNAITFTQAMTLDASGNLGIGTSSPATKVTINTAALTSSYDGLTVSYNNTASGLGLYQTGSTYTYGAAGVNESWLYSSTRNITMMADGASSIIKFATGGSTERMRIDASGLFFLGTTAAVGGANARATLSSPNLTGSYGGIGIKNEANANGGYFLHFVNYNNAVIGSISQNATTTVAYNTSSDYRLKENIAPMVGALDKVALLKPVTYTWKDGGADGQGFIAHELAEVVPDCVTGEKDATREEEYEISPAIPAVLDEEGNEVTPAVEAVMGTRTVPVYQGIDTSFLVATLTAAIQEQQAMIDELKAKVAALEAA